MLRLWSLTLKTAAFEPVRAGFAMNSAQFVKSVPLSRITNRTVKRFRIAFLTCTIGLIAVAVVSTRASLCLAAVIQTGEGSAAQALDPTGTYSFFHEGEHLDILRENGQLTGFISHYGEQADDRGQHLDQFFDRLSFKPTGELSFTTKKVHGVWYEFSGTLSIAADKRPDQAGYRVIKGTLIRHLANADGKENVSQRQVEFKSLAAEAGG